MSLELRGPSSQQTHSLSYPFCLSARSLSNPPPLILPRSLLSLSLSALMLFPLFLPMLAIFSVCRSISVMLNDRGRQSVLIWEPWVPTCPTPNPPLCLSLSLPFVIGFLLGALGVGGVGGWRRMSRRLTAKQCNVDSQEKTTNKKQLQCLGGAGDTQWLDDCLPHWLTDWLLQGTALSLQNARAYVGVSMLFQVPVSVFPSTVFFRYKTTEWKFENGKKYDKMFFTWGWKVSKW